MSINISVRIPSLEKEYDVKLPETLTCERLYKAILDRADGLNSEDGYELLAKHASKRIYPDYSSQTLAEIGIKTGETIIVKKDEEAGAFAKSSMQNIFSLVGDGAPHGFLKTSIDE